MRPKTHRIELTSDQRADLESALKATDISFQKRRRAKVLLLCDEGQLGAGLKDREISRSEGITIRQIQVIRKRFCEMGLQATLERKKRESPPIPRKITGEVEARITQLACSEAPDGRSRWTLKLLAEKVVELEIIDSISDESVRMVLKKAN